MRVPRASAKADAVRGVGVGLLLFAADLFVSSRAPEVSRSKALYFSFSDFGWVLGSIVLLTVAELPAIAAALTGGVALIVLALGVAQLRCLQAGSLPAV